jgi:hypothetical protein
MYIRMQPWDAAVPIVSGLGVPWIPYPYAESPIQRVPSGFPGPGGTGPRPRAQSELGGFHVGFLSFVAIVKRPSGVG